MLSFSAGAHAGLQGSFTLYRFERDPGIVHTEGYGSGQPTANPDTVKDDQGGECVEIAAAPCTRTTAVRDSKNPAEPHLTFGPAAFTTFLTWTTATTAAG